MARCCCGGLLLPRDTYDECKSCRDWYGCGGDCRRYYTVVDVCPVTHRIRRCSSAKEGCCLQAVELEKALEDEWKRQKEEERRQRKAQEVADFRRRWRASSPSEKLRFYSKPKLLVLARRYSLKGRSRMTTAELTRALKPVVVSADFPIR